MSVDQRSQHLERVRAALSVVVYPLQYAVNIPSQAQNWVRETLVTRRSLLGENTRLRQENLLLKSEAQRFAALKAENIRLRELLESSVATGEQVVVADLLAVELEPSTQRVVLDKGSQQGVYLGQPIVDAHGVMGQIIHTGPFSSIGMLITDISHSLAVHVNRSGHRGILTGTGASDRLEVSYLPVNADVREGDLIISSGLGGRFPAGYPVAKVVNVVIDPSEPFAKVTASPIARLGQAREVLLVWPEQRTADLGRVTVTSIVAR